MENSNTEENFAFDFDPDFDIFGDEIEKGSGGYEDMDSVPNADPGVFLPNTEGRSEFLPPDAERVPKIEQALKQDTPEYAKRPAIERARELFGYMYPHRLVLYKILQSAQEIISNTDMEKRINEIRANKFSVYSPTNLCTMLEVAGALDRVDNTGAPYIQKEAKPDIIVEDGEQYYVPSTPEPVYWYISEAGTQVLSEHDVDAKLKKELENDKDYLCIYKRVMRIANQDGGTTMAELSAAVDGDPLISKPHRIHFVQHYVETLERCEAMEWDGSKWHLTDLGKQVYEKDFADIKETDYEPEKNKNADNATEDLITETQGVSW